jgi:hypothetical protein
VGTATIGRPLVSAIAAGRRAAADAHQRVGLGLRGGGAGAFGGLDRDVHGHVVVPEGDGKACGDPADQFGLPRGRDHQHPLGAESADLAPQRRRDLLRLEADALRKGFVDELHVRVS